MFDKNILCCSGIGGMNRRTADVFSPGYATLFKLDKEDLEEVVAEYPEAQVALQNKADEIMREKGGGGGDGGGGGGGRGEGEDRDRKETKGEKIDKDEEEEKKEERNKDDIISEEPAETHFDCTDSNKGEDPINFAVAATEETKNTVKRSKFESGNNTKNAVELVLHNHQNCPGQKGGQNDGMLKDQNQIHLKSTANVGTQQQPKVLVVVEEDSISLDTPVQDEIQKMEAGSNNLTQFIEIRDEYDDESDNSTTRAEVRIDITSPGPSTSAQDAMRHAPENLQTLESPRNSSRLQHQQSGSKEVKKLLIGVEEENLHPRIQKMISQGSNPSLMDLIRTGQLMYVPMR